MSLARSGLMAVGNTVAGLLVGGNVVSTYYKSIDKYTYGNSSVAAAGSLGYVRGYGAAAGNEVFGLIGAGSAAINYDSTEKYFYASGTIAVGSIIYTARRLAACGNAQLAIFGGGVYYAILAVTKKYAYSNSVTADGTNLGYARYNLMAVGSKDVAIFAGGNANTATDKYTYANDARVVGTALSTSIDSGSGASNSSLGLIGGTPDVNVYRFVEDTRIMGASLSIARYEAAAVSSTPCWAN